MENRALQERALGISNHKFNSNSIRALKAGGVRQEIHRSREVSLAKWLVQRRSNNSSHLDELLAESAAAEEGVPQQLELVETADEDEPLLLFVTPPSDSLLCTIHQGLLVDPVIAPCGHTFCRACVEAEVAISRRGSSISNASSPVVLKRTSSSRPTSGGGSGGKSTCPVDGMALDADKVIPNLAVADQLLEVPVRCKYGIKRLENGTLEADPEGCPEVVALGARRQHESACHYAPAQCPYCDASFLLRMNVAEHTRLCSHIPCPHKVPLHTKHSARHHKNIKNAPISSAEAAGLRDRSRSWRRTSVGACMKDSRRSLPSTMRRRTSSSGALESTGWRMLPCGKPWSSSPCRSRSSLPSSTPSTVRLAPDPPALFACALTQSCSCCSALRHGDPAPDGGHGGPAGGAHRADRAPALLAERIHRAQPCSLPTVSSRRRQFISAPIHHRPLLKRADTASALSALSVPLFPGLLPLPSLMMWLVRVQSLTLMCTASSSRAPSSGTR